MESKQMQNYSIKWNYSSYSAGIFLHKSSPRTKNSWYCTIGFLINTAPLYFILHYHLFFRKEYVLFLNDNVIVNMIFVCCYLFFGWEIGHPLSRYDMEILTVPVRGNLKAQYEDLCYRDERKICCIYQRKKQIAWK